MMAKSYILNALLRCTRDDDLAAPIFDLVRADLGLWVLELPDGISQEMNLEEGVDAIYQSLLENNEHLEALGAQSTDFMLHITFYGVELVPLVLPSQLLILAARCGFGIEVCRED